MNNTFDKKDEMDEAKMTEQIEVAKNEKLVVL